MTYRFTPLLAGAALLAVPVAGPSTAQESQALTYDVHGRLTTVARTQGGTTRTTVYGLDDAHNRASRVTTVSGGGAMAAATPAPITLQPRPTEQASADPAAAPVRSTASSQPADVSQPQSRGAGQ